MLAFIRVCAFVICLNGVLMIATHLFILVVFIFYLPIYSYVIYDIVRYVNVVLYIVDHSVISRCVDA